MIRGLSIIWIYLGFDPINVLWAQNLKLKQSKGWVLYKFWNVIVVIWPVWPSGTYSYMYLYRLG